MEFKNILFTVEAGVARLTLNRPDKLNSFTGEMHAELRTALDSVQADKAVRVLVLTGAGRAFCAGQDLADPDMQTVDGKMPDIGNVVEANYKPLVLRLQNLRVPTIAAVNGIAARAPAWRWPATWWWPASRPPSCRPSARSAWCPTPAAPGSCPSASAWPGDGPGAAGRQAARREGRRVGPDLGGRGRRRLCRRIDALAAQLAAMPTKALVRTRQAMHAAPGHTLEQQLSFEGSFMRELGWSPDYAEGVAAFMEKRAPKFTGE
jgi:2-(1,2-epoxy-1,2-dihydrophenyl)acetyl-CoA isomerase